MIPAINIKLYMPTGTGSKRRIIDKNAAGDDIFDYQNQTSSSKNDLLKGLIGFHCFMGCDTLSSFAGRAKLKPLKLFFTHSDYVNAFRALGTEQHLMMTFSNNWKNSPFTFSENNLQITKCIFRSSVSIQ